MQWRWLAIWMIGWFWPVGHARADESILCRAAVGAAESSLRIPDAFLSAIARVESGRPDRQTGVLAPWPWTINAEGKGSFFPSKAEAIEAVRALQARGVRSIDVGCMQVNLMHHPEAFASLEQAFDPAENANFAGRLLLSLFAQTRAWPRAAAAYHSQTPTIGAAYQERVLAEWAVPEGAASVPRREAAEPPVTPTPPAPPMAAAARVASSFGRVGAFTARASPTGTGRDLAAYRAMPTFLATSRTLRPG